MTDLPRALLIGLLLLTIPLAPLAAAEPPCGRGGRTCEAPEEPSDPDPEPLCVTRPRVLPPPGSHRIPDMSPTTTCLPLAAGALP